MSLRYPVNSVVVSQGFGVNPAYYNKIGQKGHNGIDLAVPSNTPVYAPDDGTVTFEGWGQNHSWLGAAAGIYVLLNHGGSYSGVAHLAGTVVNKGQKVTKGQLIGYSDTTGLATGPHVHFEMIPLAPNFQNGYAGRVDITPYIDKNTPSKEEVMDKQDIRNLMGAAWGYVSESDVNNLAGKSWHDVMYFLLTSWPFTNRIGLIPLLEAQNAGLVKDLDTKNSTIQQLTEENEKLKKQGGVDQETKDNVNWLVKAFKSVFNIK